MKDKKHNHKLTDLLKFLIFSIVMLAPLLAVSSTITLNTFNKVIKGQEEVDKYETNEVNQATDLKVGNIYHYTLNYGSLTNGTNIATVGNIYNINNQNNKIEVEGYNNFKLVRGNTSINIYYNDTVFVNLYNISNNRLECDLIYTGITLIDSYTNYSKCTNIPKKITTSDEEAKNNNLFYEAVDELNNNDLFNWAENTGVYTAINTMTTGLGITETTIPMLLSYWTMITAIYVVFDIIIGTFTMITHMISEKSA